jgi:hypothetical protein
MKTATRLDRLLEEKQCLQTQLVQIQSMLHSIDHYIAEELLSQAELHDDESDPR